LARFIENAGHISTVNDSVIRSKNGQNAMAALDGQKTHALEEFTVCAPDSL